MSIFSRKSNSKRSLGPQSFSDFRGQDNATQQLEIAVGYANQKNLAIDHTILAGPPGLGKTTLAHIMANERGTTLSTHIAGEFHRWPVMHARLVSAYEEYRIKKVYPIILLDEIHMLSKHVMQMLYSFLEDNTLEGRSDRLGPIDHQGKQFCTIIGCTTEIGDLLFPFRQRFPEQVKLDLYDSETLKQILVKQSFKMGLTPCHSGIDLIVGASRQTVRIAMGLICAVNKLIEVDRLDPKIDAAKVHRVMGLRRIDGLGLTDEDRRVLKALYDGPKSSQTLAAMLDYDNDNNIKVEIEPYLIRQGFMERTPRGRQLSPRGFEYLDGLEGFGDS